VWVCWGESTSLSDTGEGREGMREERRFKRRRVFVIDVKGEK
jgi:hypothetical protein